MLSTDSIPNTSPRVGNLTKDIQVNPNTIPARLKALDQWVTWQYITRAGKSTKVLHNPQTGAKADATERSSWGTFEQAWGAYSRPHSSYSGVGFVFSADDDLVGLDADHVKQEDGQLEPWVQEAITRVSSYAEFSPSGEGAHIILEAAGAAAVLEAGKRFGTLGFEAYTEDRFFTVTGQRIPDAATDVEQRPEEFRAVYADLHALHVILQKVMAKANTDDAFKALWAGDNSGYDDDDSRGDLALCSKLAWVLEGDTEAIDKAFRHSKRLRAKWTEKRGSDTYGAQTVRKAVERYQSSPKAQAGTGNGNRLPDQEDAALWLKDNATQGLAYDRQVETWRSYTGACWEALEPESTGLYTIVTEALTAVGVRRTPRNVVDTLKMARRHMLRTFSSSGRLIAFENGTLEVDTQGLREHRPEDSLTFSLPYAYTPHTDTPIIDAFLDQCMPDKVAQAAYRTHAGLSLLGNKEFHYALLLLGAPGTGKTTALRLYNMVLGQSENEFADGAIFQREHEGMLARAAYRDWRGMALDEFPAEALKSEDMFKAMTAHSGVQSRMHNAPPITGQWGPKTIIATNDIPQFNDRTGAIKRRLLVIGCPQVIDGVQDHKLTTKLGTELGAFVAQCLAAALEAVDTGRYPISPTMLEAYEEIATEGDALKAFVDERCELTVNTGADCRVLSSRLYEAWKLWSQDNGSERYTGSNISFSKRARAYAPWKIETHRDTKGAWLRGIGLKDVAEGTKPKMMRMLD